MVKVGGGGPYCFLQLTHENIQRRQSQTLLEEVGVGHEVTHIKLQQGNFD